MSTVTKDSYLRLIANRPYKFAAEEVDYREAEGQERCENCLHFYQRRIDDYGVCEIFRDGEGDDEESIEPTWVCSFHTTNGANFPLLIPKGKTSA